ncbi:FABP family protein [Microbacterium telephonicum]|uniref:Peroxynitrite isomerase n=1 Tax=Microbacterium telephonicum TaxID=1714841 RepID=A0A498BWS5_9MICO|nr:FABP family protein [Microbacterium telephonicum]RLK47417.1 uncharacterized protein DUF1794 [Microbacterium telephonicum]
MIDLPTDLPADLVPLSWLLGVWEGTGVIDYDTGDHHYTGEFAHRVSFSHDGGDHLNYSASAWIVGDDDTRTPLVSEIGYWRLARPAGDEDAGPGLLPARATRSAPRTADDVETLRTAEGGFEIEVSIVHSDGISELYLGQVKGPRIDIATDAVVRPAGAKEYGAATRLYGLVDAHLLWAWDIAAVGGELSSHASARLAREQ